jgi:nonribosomal peptide synthetase DhbF
MRATSCVTVTTLFEERAFRFPDAIAVVDASGAVSYAALNESANRVAWTLILRGIGSEDVVGVAGPRSSALLCAVLGILKAGAVYLPLDFDQPPARLDAMLADAKPALILGGSGLGGRERCGVPIVTIEACLDEHTRTSRSNPTDAHRVRALASQNAAYVIYTSGSTGVPKGVVVTHDALRGFVGAIRRRLSLGANESQCAATPITFDISLLELIAPLCAGARVILASREQAGDPDRLWQLCKREAVTCMQATPTYWAAIANAPRRADLRVLAGGEALPAKVAQRLIGLGGDIWNLYGPTEATVWATAHRVRAADVEHATAAVAIGAPLDDYEIYVLDDRYQPVRGDERGELWIAGRMLARGYLRNPRQTAERFVPDPFGPPGCRMYRTGDVGGRQADGTLTFIGRIDSQVKIRGVRVELGEIEAALERCAGIARAAAVLQDDEPRPPRLAAYVVCEPGFTVDSRTVRQMLADRLPDVMIPVTIIVLDELPTTPHGKLDRSALPQCAIDGRSSAGDAMTPFESLVSGLFAEVLGVTSVGAADDFFELGGHSMAATQLLNQLRAHCGCELTIDTLLQASRVADLALLVDEHAHRAHSVTERER